MAARASFVCNLLSVCVCVHSCPRSVSSHLHMLTRDLVCSSRDGSDKALGYSASREIALAVGARYKRAELDARAHASGAAGEAEVSAAAGPYNLKEDIGRLRVPVAAPERSRVMKRPASRCVLPHSPAQGCNPAGHSEKFVSHVAAKINLSKIRNATPQAIRSVNSANALIRTCTHVQPSSQTRTAVQQRQ